MSSGNEVFKIIMGVFYVYFHHGGYFVGTKYEGGEVSNCKCDEDRWNYFEIFGVIKEMGYSGVLEMWYDFGGILKCLGDDFDAIELLNWSKSNGKVNIFIVRPISQHDIILEVEHPH